MEISEIEMKEKAPFTCPCTTEEYFHICLRYEYKVKLFIKLQDDSHGISGTHTNIKKEPSILEKIKWRELVNI